MHNLVRRKVIMDLMLLGHIGIVAGARTVSFDFDTVAPAISGSSVSNRWWVCSCCGPRAASGWIVA